MNIDRIITHVNELIRYIKERIVLRNFVLAFLILVFGTSLIMQILKIYTRHNYNLNVPDFRGLSLSEAQEIADQKELKLVVFDSVFLTDFEKGTIVEHHPKADFKVKKNRKIFLTMNAINPERVAMPNLVDLTRIQASAKLESFGLKVGHISYEPNIAINVVLVQRINGEEIIAGDSVIKGSSIDLVLGNGLSDEQAAIPNLIGLSLEEAKTKALDRNLNIGASVHDQTIIKPEDEIQAVIFKQKPEPVPGITLPLGSEIDVWITLDSAKVNPFHFFGDSLSVMP